MKRILYTLVSLSIIAVARSQGNKITEEATGLRADGKIWVVMAVCLTILSGLFIYLISLDRKISKLENTNK